MKRTIGGIWLLALCGRAAPANPNHRRAADEQHTTAPYWDDLAELAQQRAAASALPKGATGSPCAPECELHGNCNTWTGECECPYHRHGVACQKLAMPACALGADAVHVRTWLQPVLVEGAESQPFIGALSCDCLKQTLNMRHMLHVTPPNERKWQGGGVRVICAMRSGAGAESLRELSVEEVLAAPQSLVWKALELFPRFSPSAREVWRGLGSGFFRTGPPQDPTSSARRDEALGKPLRPGARRKGEGGEHTQLVPLELCPEQCGGQGYCSRLQERPECVCFRGSERARSGSCRRGGQSGATAGDKTVGACFRPKGHTCSAAGVCDGFAFCHCTRGRWGVDCAHALGPRGRPVVRASGSQARVRDVQELRPRVFVYSLPPLLSDGPGFYADLWMALTTELLESDYRTAEPEAADYFWLPGPLRYGHAVDKLRFVRQRWPYWNRTVAAGRESGHGLARHVTYTGWELDPGKIVSHTAIGSWPEAMLLPEEDAEINVASPTRAWLALSHNGMADAVPNSAESAGSVGVRCVVCFQGGKDVVVPFKPGIIDVPLCSQLSARSIWSKEAKAAARGHSDDARRSTVFFFAGSHPVPKPNAGKGKSTGLQVYAPPHVREDMHRLHGRTAGFQVVDSRAGAKVEAVEWMLKSHFCWVPPGQRYGDPRRHILSSSFGCIPVFTLPNGHLAFDELLPWASMAVLVNRSELPRLPAILANYSQADRERMRAQLRCAWPRLWFSSLYGSCFGDDPRFDAFDALMATLRYRLRGPGIARPAHASSPDACAQMGRPLRRLLDDERALSPVVSET